MIQYTVKARFTDTRLIRHLIITDSLLCPWGGKVSLIETRLIRTPR